MAEDWDWSACTPAQEDMAMEALRGLFRGDLAPLVTYLRSDFPFDPVIRTNLAAMIDGSAGFPFQVEIVTKDGRRKQRWDTLRQDFNIWHFVHDYERANPGSRESAVNHAAKVFHLSERRIWRALRIWPRR